FWAYLSATPLLGLTATLIAYQGGLWLYNRTNRFALFNPVLVAIVALIAFLKVSGMNYEAYFDGAQFIHFMLGPATVALAVPLYQQLERVRRSALAILVSVVVGSVTAVVTAVGAAWMMGASKTAMLSIAPKSVTTPIAMGISEITGGAPSLTAVLVILTGILGAVGGAWLLDAFGVKDERARGLAMGAACHGIGTARAFQMGEVAGAFSGLAMGLNGLATAVLLPVLLHLFF
ncbi:MAG: LrgB family protein, partial [Alphaproteobacteria bacterium]|nr:LrgB family protein [Alphaproteobacteria bacterium]